MSQIDERSYLLSRERLCRELAERASDPGARKAHLEMAERYAERAALGIPIRRATGGPTRERHAHYPRSISGLCFPATNADADQIQVPFGFRRLDRAT